MDEKKNQIVERAGKLLSAHSGRRGGVRAAVCLAGDGSPRRFYRLRFDRGGSVIAVAPPGYEPAREAAEARAAWRIGRHLAAAGVGVPEPLGFDEETGLILFEDLGDAHLQDVLLTEEYASDESRFALYGQVVRELVRLQLRGADGFDPAWCWQTSHYDRQLMLARESGYFLQAFCRELCRLSPDLQALRREFEDIADRAAEAPADFFLHRDFQSRNIMIRAGRVRIIDFQGGRLGPLAYDLASLLIDPYVCLSETLQERLLDTYLAVLAEYIEYDPVRFREEYLYLALQRNLQILGAFAFLGGQRGKVRFFSYLRPALISLEKLLIRMPEAHFPELTRIVQLSKRRIDEEISRRG